jgi:hypothetical protein
MSSFVDSKGTVQCVLSVPAGTVLVLYSTRNKHGYMRMRLTVNCEC